MFRARGVLPFQLLHKRCHSTQDRGRGQGTKNGPTTDYRPIHHADAEATENGEPEAGGQTGSRQLTSPNQRPA
jgi:hypothetical protein